MRPGRFAAIVTSAALASGCAKTLAFGTATKFALDISQKVSEIPSTVPEFQEFLALQQETAKRLSEK